MDVDPKKVRELRDEKAFYAWLAKNWDKETELWIKMHKVGSGRPSITPKEAIDAALSWGWIDGIRKGYDETSFLQRFTPRGKKSVWSAVNVANVARLIAEKKMQAPGLAQVEAAKADGRWAKAYSTKDAPPEDLLAAIRAKPKALKTYEGLTAQNRFALVFRTLAMKTDAGRKKKIATLVAMLERGETLHPQAAPRSDALALPAQLRALDAPVREIVEAARSTVQAAVPKAIETGCRMAAPKSKSMMWKLCRYGRPSEKGYIAAIGAFTRHAAIFFAHGADLDDPLLEGTGKQLRYVSLRTRADAESAALKRLVRKAFARP